MVRAIIYNVKMTDEKQYYSQFPNGYNSQIEKYIQHAVNDLFDGEI